MLDELQESLDAALTEVEGLPSPWLPGDLRFERNKRVQRTRRGRHVSTPTGAGRVAGKTFIGKSRIKKPKKHVIKFHNTGLWEGDVMPPELVEALVVLEEATLLLESGGANGNAPAKFPSTSKLFHDRRHVKLFQKHVGLKPDGIVGRKTLAAVRAQRRSPSVFHPAHGPVKVFGKARKNTRAGNPRFGMTFHRATMRGKRVHIYGSGKQARVVTLKR